MITTLAPGAFRDAQFTDAGVVVRLQATDTGTFTLAVRYLSGPNVDRLHRAYADVRTATNAYRGMATLFAAGYTVAAVIDFAEQHAPVAVAEYPLTACEVAA